MIVRPSRYDEYQRQRDALKTLLLQQVSGSYGVSAVDAAQSMAILMGAPDSSPDAVRRRIAAEHGVPVSALEYLDDPDDIEDMAVFIKRHRVRKADRLTDAGLACWTVALACFITALCVAADPYRLGIFAAPVVIGQIGGILVGLVFVNRAHAIDKGDT